MVDPDDWSSPRQFFAFGGESTNDIYAVSTNPYAGRTTQNTPGVEIHRGLNEAMKSAGTLAEDRGKEQLANTNIYCELDYGETITFRAWKNGWEEDLWASASARDTTFDGELLGFGHRTGSEGTRKQTWWDYLHQV